MAKFEFLRLSLSVPVIGDLARQGVRYEPDLSRTEYLREFFSQRRDFFYYGRVFTFVPSPAETLGPDIYSGYVGRQITEIVNAGPDELFALTKQNHYKASFVAVNIRADQQLVAFEKKVEVGSSLNILKEMFSSYVRARKSHSWHTDIEYVSSSDEFWDAARKYKGRITELSFEFFPPNGLSGFDRFKEFDRLAKSQTNGQSSQYSLKNRDGNIVPEGEFVESAVAYAAEGPGNIQMKDGRNIIFSSRQAKKIIEAPEPIMPRQGEPSKILGLVHWLFGLKQ